jgi:hypothetical protein
VTPGECIKPIVSAGSLTSIERPVAASNARRTTSSGPAAMANGISPAERVTDGGGASCAWSAPDPSADITKALVANSRYAPFFFLRGTTTIGRTNIERTRTLLTLRRCFVPSAC